jgi:outer membrane lipoprotein SlyB
MKSFATRFATRTLFAAALAAAGAMPALSQAAPEHHRSEAQCQNCGTVVSTHSYQRAAERGSGVGAVGGAVLGGILGHQVGSGRGQTLATVAGAAGGAYAGNHVERNMHAQTYTDVRIRMARGGYRTITEQGSPRFRGGEHVRVDGSRIIRD